MQKFLKIALKYGILNALCFTFIACSAKIPDNKSLTQDLMPNFTNISLISQNTNQKIQNSTPIEQMRLLFDDSTLDALLEIAAQKNLDLQITQTRILQAQAQLKTAWGDLFPTINGSLNTETSKSRSNTTPVIKTHSYSTQIGATLSWEFDLFGRLRQTKNAKQSLYEKSLQDLENAKITLFSDIATLYFTLLETQKNLILTQDNITHYANALELTRLKVENGLLDSTELFEKQDLLTEEQNTLERLKSIEEESKNALLVLLDTSTLPFRIQQNLPQPKTQFNLANLPADTLLSRPDIKAALFSLHAQIYTKANAKASLFPILSISANIGEILDSTTQSSGNLAWGLASSLSAPILNRTQLTQNYFLQDALLKESYLTLQKSLKDAFFEIENASFNTNSAQTQLQNSHRRLKNAQNYYEFSFNRHTIGLIDTLEHALNSASLNNAQKSLNTAQSENLKTLVTLYKAFGGNLNLHKESYADN
ncbi:efflux transporter outer membrane subunit [Helicobacter sp. MIT 11-5569]|uniref:efflux transporter outer membrane subunit n=1 Tax=Helicobacter sp. MIT 11-5569 TaxID=1548151 RepID=UPI0009DD1D1D|nr:efflux transporter outer membrane subunit [Helicobacter sp. MIT 11-5569]TLD85269.1 efflux transporter outer membrane subunit [Helicobacter sp. MIT 11-5569]